VRDAIVLAIFPAVAALLAAMFVLLPKQFMSPLTVWLFVEALIACGLVTFYVLERKHHVGKTYPLFFLILLASLFVVVSYIPWSAQVYAYITTAAVTLFIYLRLFHEFRRRGYI